MSVVILTEPSVSDYGFETPLDRYRAAQRDHTAVDRFSQRHDSDVLTARSGRYQELIPSRDPESGEQYGFEVDLDACTGCKSCVAACHSLNGLDDGEQFRTVGELRGGTADDPWRQTVTTACHHCVEPACLEGCPVNAYEKDPISGIVKHLDDQCIGCSYCELSCPYSVPRLNKRLGIVRKCDLCADRLAVGEAPACVQGCPTNAISVKLVTTSTVRAAAAESVLVPGAPHSLLTLPVTRYRSHGPLPLNAVAADLYSVRPGRSHPPLAVMLVLTQLSVGTYLFLFSLRLSGLTHRDADLLGALGTLAMAGLALAASTFHLGRPRYAYRAVLGLRRSWLSREIVGFGLFTVCTTLSAISSAQGGPPLLGVPAAVAGLASIYCSVRIYSVTGRSWWRPTVTLPKFVLTSWILGAQTTVILFAGLNARHEESVTNLDPIRAVLVSAAVAALLKAVVELAVLFDPDPECIRTVNLLRRNLLVSTKRRIGLGLAGGLVLPVALFLIASDQGSVDPAVSAGVFFALSIVMVIITALGELIERMQFFTASSPAAMPGPVP